MRQLRTSGSVGALGRNPGGHPISSTTTCRIVRLPWHSGLEIFFGDCMAVRINLTFVENLAFFLETFTESDPLKVVASSGGISTSITGWERTIRPCLFAILILFATEIPAAGKRIRRVLAKSGDIETRPGRVGTGFICVDLAIATARRILLLLNATHIRILLAVAGGFTVSVTAPKASFRNASRLFFVGNGILSRGASSAGRRPSTSSLARNAIFLILDGVARLPLFFACRSCNSTAAKEERHEDQ